jgi:molecular chaperone DnaK
VSKVIGIDLGTTFSAIAYVNKYGQPEIIANREGERTTPSVIWFDGDAPIVGTTAKRCAVANPLDVVQFVKRQMGQPNYSFHTDRGKVYKGEELSAMILKRLKEDAEAMLGETISDAVITVPAYFDDSQRKATQDAGKIAGLNVLRIINEPTAAAFAYGLNKTDKKQTVLIYDLGGGTFDVTIINLDKDKIHVVATHGDKNLGGFNWDNELMQYLNNEFKRQGGVDLFKSPIFEQELRQKSEIAKIALSTTNTTKVYLSAAGKDVQIVLTLEKFQEITSSLIQTTADIMEIVLEDARLTWRDIDKTLLVGGSTRMKAVGALVEKITGKKPSREVNPDEAVAMGAALQGALLQIQTGKFGLVEREATTALVELGKIKVQDVNSHSLGVIVIDQMDKEEKREINSIIVEKNTPIPCEKGQTVYTLFNNQTGIDVQVTEGENIDIRYVKVIGESLITIEPHPKGSPIEIRYAYDADGIIHVTVFDEYFTPKKFLGEFKIKRTSNMNEQEVNEKKRNFIGLAVE